MSREFPSQINLASATKYNDVIGSDIGSSIPTSSLIDQVYRINIQQSGVLGVVSGRLLTDVIDNIPSEDSSIRVSQAINNYAYGISYTLAKDSNGNNILDSSDQFIDYKVINSNVNGFVLFQKSVTAGTYFIELNDTNGTSSSRTSSGILFDSGTLYGETLGNISDPKSSGGNSNPTLANVKQNPSVFMEKIRDYDGNNLGSGSSWKLIGDADVQGDGDLESIFVNPLIGRWATVGTVNNFVDFSKHGQGGDTRVVGIYIDPTLKDKPQNRGGPFDSQRRFQNDLKIDNLNFLAAADYNKDGFQDMYFRLGDGTAVLRALMHKDGNIQYANYQSKDDLTTFMTANNVSSSIWGSWL
jgi:hypothetical protein